ncbi:hypothetical protein OE88DRAFT_1653033 [Heliocybe sulcata]|uniref:Uncharacterized protein n=1 Tax=Heliocybe sulcata TaxID=5364 RepID=A0A5C3NDS7_9AGAM|nr:hypothetical protein OE88DRAFT_1653033 [Heliocybe sulcata]
MSEKVSLCRYSPSILCNQGLECNRVRVIISSASNARSPESHFAGFLLVAIGTTISAVLLSRMYALLGRTPKCVGPATT